MRTGGCDLKTSLLVLANAGLFDLMRRNRNVVINTLFS